MGFHELYEWWEEEPVPGDGDNLPTKEGWARDLLESLGFTLITRHFPKGRFNLDPFHDGNTLIFWDRSDERALQHELAHAVVWIAHGRPGGPQQWGIGSNPYPPQARELERLVFTVEWVLATRRGTARDEVDPLGDACAEPFRQEDPRFNPAMVVEAIRMVDEVLGA